MALFSRFALLAALPLLLSGSASSQSLPKAPKTEVISVTPKPGFFTEPSIAVNPANPLQVVAAFQDNAHIAYSVDGGRHWQLAAGIEPPNYRVSGDVSVTFDNEGRAYICYIAFDKLGTLNFCSFAPRITARRGPSQSRSTVFADSRAMTTGPSKDLQVLSRQTALCMRCGPTAITWFSPPPLMVERPFLAREISSTRLPPCLRSKPSHGPMVLHKLPSTRGAG